MKLVGKILAWIFGLFFGITLFLVILYKYVPVHVTPLMLIRSCEAIAKHEKPHIERTWVALEDISPDMVRAVIASEDNRYMTHHGFDFEELKKVIEENKHRKRPRGASTMVPVCTGWATAWPDAPECR